MAVGDLIEMRVFTSLGSQVAVNIRHYKTVTEVNGGVTLGQFAADIEPSLAAQYKAAMSTSARFEGIDMARIRPLPRTRPVAVITDAGAGSVVGDPLPGQVSGVCSLLSALAGSANRGRIYVPFPSEADNDSSHKPTTSYIDRLATICNTVAVPRTVVVGVTSSTFQPIIHKRGTANAVDIIDHRTRQFWGTQRRRGSFGAEFLLPLA